MTALSSPGSSSSSSKLDPITLDLHIQVLEIVANAYGMLGGSRPNVWLGQGGKHSVLIGNDLWVAMGENGMVSLECKKNYNAPDLGRENIRYRIPKHALENIAVRFEVGATHRSVISSRSEPKG